MDWVGSNRQGLFAMLHGGNLLQYESFTVVLSITQLLVMVLMFSL